MRPTLKFISNSCIIASSAISNFWSWVACVVPSQSAWFPFFALSYGCSSVTFQDTLTLVNGVGWSYDWTWMYDDLSYVSGDGRSNGKLVSEEAPLQVYSTRRIPRDRAVRRRVQHNGADIHHWILQKERFIITIASPWWKLPRNSISCLW
jgi:hypothetical protein